MACSRPVYQLAADWPTYQHDARRSGVTAESLSLPLAADWTLRATDPPARGWGEPETTPVYDYGIVRISRLQYDDAYQVAAVGDAVYFCDSAHNAVCCADAATGRLRWRAYTDAAPRLGPTVWQGRVYAGADDGFVRCLDAATGRPVWQFQAAAGPERAISQDRILSLWPVRTGVLVDQGLAYFGAGLFPAEGLRLYAVRADTGQLVWKNDTFDGGGTANISPQGYLLADAQRLVLPSGRVCPTVFERATGRMLFGVPNGRALVGGCFATLTERFLYTGTQMIGAYDLNSSKPDKWGHAIWGWNVFGWFDSRRILVHGDRAYLATPRELLAIDEDRLPAAAAEVDKVRKLRWERRNQLAEYQRTTERWTARAGRQPGSGSLSGRTGSPAAARSVGRGGGGRTGEVPGRRVPLALARRRQRRVDPGRRRAVGRRSRPLGGDRRRPRNDTAGAAGRGHGARAGRRQRAAAGQHDHGRHPRLSRCATACGGSRVWHCLVLQAVSAHGVQPRHCWSTKQCHTVEAGRHLASAAMAVADVFRKRLPTRTPRGCCRTCLVDPPRVGRRGRLLPGAGRERRGLGDRAGAADRTADLRGVARLPSRSRSRGGCSPSPVCTACGSSSSEAIRRLCRTRRISPT